jgi:glutathione S-transferase
MTEPRFILHHAKQSRAARILWLLEEAGAAYGIVSYDLQAGDQKRPAYLAINPDGKVPALVDRGPDGTWNAVVTESAAICAYVADVLPQANLAPPIGTPERAAYATWLVYATSVLEPALSDVVFPRAAAPMRGAIGWVPYDDALDRVDRALSPGPWLLGDRFTAADIMVGAFLNWVHSWGKLPERPHFPRYLEAVTGRDAWKRARAKEA